MLKVSVYRTTNESINPTNDPPPLIHGGGGSSRNA